MQHAIDERNEAIRQRDEARAALDRVKHVAREWDSIKRDEWMSARELHHQLQAAIEGPYVRKH